MDQGFAPQGLALPEVKLPPIARAPVVAREIAVVPKAAKAERDIGRLHRMEGILTAPFQGEFFGGIIGFLLAGAAGLMKWSRGQTIVRAIFIAPFEALRATTNGKILHFGQYYMEAVAGAATQAKGLAGERWAPAAQKRAAEMALKAEQRGNNLRTAVAPVRRAVGKGLDRFAASGLGRHTERGFDSLMQWRAKVTTAKHHKAMENASAAFTKHSPGFFGSIKNFFTGTKAPAEVAVGELAPVMAKFEAAKGLSGEALAHHLTEVNRELEALMKSKTLQGEIVGRAGNIGKYLHKAVGSAGALHTYQEAAGGTLKTMVKAVAGAAGRAPLFSTLVGAGVVAGIGATMLTAKAESAEAKTAYKELLADLGDAHHPYLNVIRQGYAKHGAKHRVKTGLEFVGNAANCIFMAIPGGGGAAVMGASFLPMVTPMLVEDNSLLNAYMALKKIESGEIKAEAAQKQMFLRQLMAVRPEIKAHGQEYNHLAAKIAEHIDHEKLSTREAVGLIFNDQKFGALADMLAQAPNDHPAPAIDYVKSKACVADNPVRIPSDPQHPKVSVCAQRELEGRIKDPQLLAASKH